MRIRLLLLLLVFIFTSCFAVQRTSKLTSENLKPGMNKDEVITACGKPYKEAFYYAEDQKLLEQLYYKEVLFVNKWVEVTSILHFENAKLMSIEQGRERPAYTEK